MMLSPRLTDRLTTTEIFSDPTRQRSLLHVWNVVLRRQMRSIRRKPDAVTSDEFVFTHASYCWHSPFDRQPASLRRWISIDEEAPRPHISGKKVILGHTPGPIRDVGYLLCIDTGCGFGGSLTAFDLTTQESWQVTEAGHHASS
jgi:hypothetical protein